MDPGVATDSLATTDDKAEMAAEEERAGRKERDWVREKGMRELLATTRGLLLHFPGSCRFNNSSSREDDDWNTYVHVRAKRSVCARFNQELSFREGDVIRVLVSAEDMWSRGMWWPGELRGKKGLFATEHIESFNQDNYDFLSDFLEDHFRGEELTQLKRLAVRQVESVPDPAGMLWECVQCPQLTELDLKGCHLVELCDELQFWAMPNLTVLNLTNTQLPYLPASVGRLKQLTTLLLSGNALTTLPSTLSFCSSLSTLDLQNNNFSILPAVIFRIESLTLLRRHGNYDMRGVIAELSASTRRERYVTVVQERMPLLSSSVKQQHVVPLKLLAVRAVMTERLDYWANKEVAPALCRVLDISQTEYKICDNCCSAQPLDMTGFRIRWLVESYLGLRHVPFEHFACSPECARRLNDSFQAIQGRLKKEHDEAYQSMLDQHAAAESGGVAGGGGAPGGKRSRQQRRRRWSFLGGRSMKQLEIREMWCTEWASTSPALYGRGGFPGTPRYPRHLLHHHGNHSSRHGNHRGRNTSGNSCSIM